MFRLCCATLSRNSIANDNQGRSEAARTGYRDWITKSPFALSVVASATESKWHATLRLRPHGLRSARTAYWRSPQPVSSPRLASPAARLSGLNTNGAIAAESKGRVAD